MSVPAGTWVEVENVLLTKEQRAAGCPDDTKATPYLRHVSGFLTEDAEMGDEVTVTSLIGREHTGKLILVDPHYEHTFGPTVRELLVIGLKGDVK